MFRDAAEADRYRCEGLRAELVRVRADLARAGIADDGLPCGNCRSLTVEGWAYARGQLRWHPHLLGPLGVVTSLFLGETILWHGAGTAERLAVHCASCSTLALPAFWRVEDVLAPEAHDSVAVLERRLERALARLDLARHDDARAPRCPRCLGPLEDGFVTVSSALWFSSADDAHDAIGQGPPSQPRYDGAREGAGARVLGYQGSGVAASRCRGTCGVHLIYAPGG